MEAVRNPDAIAEFLAEVEVDHDGYGYGYGSGSGYGYGYGSGYGYGDGSGYGSGYGSGDGDGDGIRSFCGEAVHQIDGIPTILRRLRGNIAKGAILNIDFTTTPCFVVKQNGLYAHGSTLREAMSALTDKLFDGMSEDQRIQAFMAAHQWGKTYPNQDLYAWHHRLTGSCDMGRRAFAQDHGIDVEHGSMTVEEFIRLTRDAYGSATIRKLEAAYQQERS